MASQSFLQGAVGFSRKGDQDGTCLLPLVLMLSPRSDDRWRRLSNYVQMSRIPQAIHNPQAHLQMILEVFTSHVPWEWREGRIEGVLALAILAYPLSPVS